jgi:hypothetical protein
MFRLDVNLRIFYNHPDNPNKQRLLRAIGSSLDLPPEEDICEGCSSSCMSGAVVEDKFLCQNCYEEKPREKPFDSPDNVFVSNVSFAGIEVPLPTRYVTVDFFLGMLHWHNTSILLMCSPILSVIANSVCPLCKDPSRALNLCATLHARPDHPALLVVRIRNEADVVQ